VRDELLVRFPSVELLEMRVPGQPELNLNPNLSLSLSLPLHRLHLVSEHPGQSNCGSDP
jgi:hypothetical protein